MGEKPRYGIVVRNIQRSLHFYRDQLGLPVEIDTGVADTAILNTSKQPAFVLAGPEAPDWAEILDLEYTVLNQADTIFIGDPDFDQRVARLSHEGAVDYELIDRPWGDRMIVVTDPDGYRVSLWMIREQSREEIVDQYRSGRNGLRQLTKDLTDDQLNWRPHPDAWSVREVVHHLADSELTVFHVARAALAEPGTEYRSNPYHQNHYARELRYQQRDIEPSLRLFEAARDQMLEMVEVIPDSWTRTARTSGGGETSIEQYLRMLATHALEHLEQIKELRRTMPE
jgi:catechol 2,3-dioxygenase-like lactoylglutathione lyase family enzyme